MRQKDRTEISPEDLIELQKYLPPIINGSIFSREDEYSLAIATRDPELLKIDKFALKDLAIARILALLLENYNAFPCGLNLWHNSRESVIRELRWMQMNILRSVGAMLPSGELCHRESAAPYLEISKPLINDPEDFCRRTRRSDQIAGFTARSVSQENFRVKCFNAVSDRQGNSCGMHRSVLTERKLYTAFFREGSFKLRRDPASPDEPNPNVDVTMRLLSRKAQDMTSCHVLTAVFRGEGKTGFESGANPAFYQISGRSDFFAKIVGGNSTHERPLNHTRDEPHAYHLWYARHHVLTGEGNRSPWASMLDAGLLAAFHMTLGEDALDLDWYLAEPVWALHELSRDLNLSREIKIVKRKNQTVSSAKWPKLMGDILRQLYDFGRRAKVPSWFHTIVGEAEHLVRALKDGDPNDEAGKMLDWKIKYKFLSDFMKEKLGLNPDDRSSWQHPRVQAADITYHRLDDERLWLPIGEKYGVRDFEKFLYPYGQPEQPDFWEVGPPEDNRSYLVNLLATDPHLKKRTSIMNWLTIYLWNETSTDQVRLLLGCPHAFSKKHLTDYFGSAPDFSTPEKREALIQFIERFGLYGPRGPVWCVPDLEGYRVVDVERPEPEEEPKDWEKPVLPAQDPDQISDRKIVDFAIWAAYVTKQRSLPLINPQEAGAKVVRPQEPEDLVERSEGKLYLPDGSEYLQLPLDDPKNHN